MEKKESDLLLKKTIDGLYKGREVTEEMKDISMELIWNSFSLHNIFGADCDVRERYICTNPDGEQGIIDVIRWDGYNYCDNSVKKVKVVLPFIPRKLERLGSSTSAFLTENPDNHKKGVIEVNTKKYLAKQAIEEKYDGIEKVDDGVYIVKIGDKFGRVNTRNNVYDIPARYDEIKDGRLVTCVRLGDKWGAYCYAFDEHCRYSHSSCDFFAQSYIKKRFVPPIFDNVRLAIYDKRSRKTFLYVTLGDKTGVLDAYDRQFVVPVVFDEIRFGVHMNSGIFMCYGYIDGDWYMYNGDFFVKKDGVPLSQEYQDTKNIIENYGVSKKAKANRQRQSIWEKEHYDVDIYAKTQANDVVEEKPMVRERVREEEFEDDLPF